MARYQQTLAAAHQILADTGNRSEYAIDVLNQRQNWSGSDLTGNARKWGATYSRYRSRAWCAWEEAGGDIIPVEKNKLVSAVRITDSLYETQTGYAIPNPNSSWPPGSLHAGQYRSVEEALIDQREILRANTQEV